MIWWLLLVLIVPFGYVLLSGAPYVPVRKAALRQFLTKLKVQKGQTLLDLGSGDGTVLKIACEEFGMKGIGVELNPFLVWASRFRLRKVQPSLVQVYLADMWKFKISKHVDYVYVFGHPRFMDRIARHIEQQISKPTIVISYSFGFNDRAVLLEEDGFIAYLFKPLDKDGANK